QAQGVGVDHSLGIGVQLAVDAAHEVEGGVKDGKAAVVEIAVKLRNLQRRVVFEGGGGVGDALDRVPAAQEQRMAGGQLDQLAVGENFLQLAAESLVERLEPGRGADHEQAAALHVGGQPGPLRFAEL